MEQVQIGIIGGSGLYDMAEVTDRTEVSIRTPFGDPSGPYVIGTLRGKRVAFLSRHGVGHRLSPSELNFRANIFGMKLLGVDYILSASAVGSLKQDYKPLDIVSPDQFIDRTRGRVSTFFGRGLVAHIAFAHPFCKLLSEVVLANVISSNCADFAVTDEEWSLLTDSADILAHGQLGIGVNDFDNLFYDPAFETLDEPGACDKHGPQVQPVIDKLVALGGSREALPDQEAAYQAEQARQLGWDAMALSPGKTKTK